MTRRSPLPQRCGLDAVRYVVGPSLPARSAHDRLLDRFPALGDPAATPLWRRFARGEVVRADGTPWQADEMTTTGDALWFHRELRPETVPDMDLPILQQDDHLLVVDKPHDMATMPRGRHVLASALVRLRQQTGLEQLSPIHRLDRRTAGVLAFSVNAHERAAYQGLFARRQVDKTYQALVLAEPGSALPARPGEQMVLRDHLTKPCGSLQVQVAAGAPNAVTEVEVLAVHDAPRQLNGPRPRHGPEPSPRESAPRLLELRLRPLTGRTHQLRVQLAARDAPIIGDDLYPVVRPEESADGPLRLLAERLAFTDPLTGHPRSISSTRDLEPPRQQ